MSRRWVSVYQLGTAFCGGAVIMALEIVGFRLFAPYFGYSVYVWGGLLGVIMLALAVGYAVGGRLADRSGRPALLYCFILAAACYTLLVYYGFPWLMRPLLHGNLILVTLWASLLVYGPPMCCLSMIAPFLIGIRARQGVVGTTAGGIYALSTMGSIAGTFLAAFYLLPTWGTQATILTCVVVLVGLAGIGLLMTSRWGTVVILLLLPVVAVPSRWTARDPFVQHRTVLLDTESRYGRIVVADDPHLNARVLQTAATATQSAMVHGRLLSGRSWFWDFFTLGPVFVPSAQRFLLLGVAGGVAIRQLHFFFPSLEIDAVEIDEKMWQAAEAFFGVTDLPQVHRHTADARPFLERGTDRYDVIGVDLYGGGLYIPFYVASAEFYAAVRNRLTMDGVMIMNTSGPTEALVNTVAAVFPAVFRIEGVSICLAFPRSMTVEAVRTRLRQFNIVTVQAGRVVPSAPDGIDPDREWAALEDLLVKAWEGLYPVPFDPGRIVMTDDRSPIDQLTYAAHAENRGE